MRAVRLMLGAALLAAGPVLAAEVELPEGSMNGASGSCPEGAVTATLSGNGQEWALKPGDRLEVVAADGSDWKIACAEGGVTISVGTGCFDDGYIVAGFEPGAARIACYEGEIPAGLKQ